MKKTDCIKLGLGICPKSEVWAKNPEPCGKCNAYLPPRERR